jgi:hypothetical protein
MSLIGGASGHFSPANPLSFPLNQIESGAQSSCQSYRSLTKITRTKEEQGSFPFLSASMYLNDLVPCQLV